MLGGSTHFKGIQILAGWKYKLEGPLLLWDASKLGHTDRVAWWCQGPLWPPTQGALLASVPAWARPVKIRGSFRDGWSSSLAVLWWHQKLRSKLYLAFNTPQLPSAFLGNGSWENFSCLASSLGGKPPPHEQLQPCGKCHCLFQNPLILREWAPSRSFCRSTRPPIGKVKSGREPIF